MSVVTNVLLTFIHTFRYYISTKNSLIRMYVDKPYWEAFNVDGRRCENLLECEVNLIFRSSSIYSFLSLR